MSDGSKIEWTDATWGVVRGCKKVSPGCKNCYAEKVAHRFSGPGRAFEGLTVIGEHGPHWTGEARMIPKALSIPLHWRKPRHVFVCSASDLFHEDVPFEYIAAVFGVMAACPQHTFQCLTKRPKRMLEWFKWMEKEGAVREAQFQAQGYFEDPGGEMPASENIPTSTVWPLPNVWIGVSCENQETADERIPLLLQCPAAVRWVSAEPLLGPIDFDPPRCDNCGDDEIAPASDGAPAWCLMCDSEASFGHWMGDVDRELNWVVVGGESGPGARACDVGWVRSIIDQCGQAEVPVFVKQLGAKPFHSDINAAAIDSNPAARAGGWVLRNVHDPKGGDMSEWRHDLRVRQMPMGGA